LQCVGAQQLTISAQELIYAERSVLAVPVAESNEFRVVAVIKGDAPPDNTIAGGVYKADATAMQSKKPLLLIRDDAWRSWVNFGPVSAGRAGWLRKLSAMKIATDMSGAEWREHAAYFLQFLETPEPMVAEIAYNEIASAPYDALRSLKPQLDAAAIRTWLSDPKLAAREPLYFLLLGIAGTPEDAHKLEQRLATARKVSDLKSLPALIGAVLELREIAGIEFIEKLYLLDPQRTKPEVEAAVAALKVYAEANPAARDRTEEAFQRFVQQRPALAGLVPAEARPESGTARPGCEGRETQPGRAVPR
jgi:hypothetical protein